MIFVGFRRRPLVAPVSLLALAAAATFATVARAQGRKSYGGGGGADDKNEDAFLVGCDREPLAHDSPKTPGDNGFRLVVHTYPDAYIPGRTYTVSLLGQNNGDYVQSFRGFMIVSLAAGDAEEAEQQPLRGSLQVMTTTSDTAAIIQVLDASSHLCKKVCRLVCRLVSR